MTVDEQRPTTLSDNPSDAEIHAYFKDDTFAYAQADCRIIEARRGHGVAEMVLNPKKHFNAQDHVMGGAIFTLADYSFAAASVPGHQASVSLSSTIEFMKSPKGKKLIATCDVDRSGHRVEFYTIIIKDDLGELIAKVVSSCYHPSKS